jgi:hypothetical protein
VQKSTLPYLNRVVANSSVKYLWARVMATYSRRRSSSI